MKPLFIFLFGYFFCQCASAQEYIYVPCALGDTLQYQDDSLLMSSGNENFSFERIRFCDMGMLYDYASGRDTISDSLLNQVHKILTPYFGKWVSRVEVMELRYYNQWEDQPDSTTAAEYPYCKKMKYDFLCRIRFDEGIFFRFSLHTDAKGGILNKQDIPHGLDTLKQFALYPPCTIYNKAKRDKFFRGIPPRYVFHIDYSNKLKMLYYEVECNEEDATGFEKTNSWSDETFHVHYIFYNALTGEVVWRTIATEHIERGPDVINTEIQFSRNTIMNTY